MAADWQGFPRGRASNADMLAWAAAELRKQGRAPPKLSRDFSRLCPAGDSFSSSSFNLHKATELLGKCSTGSDFKTHVFNHSDNPQTRTGHASDPKDLKRSG